MNTTNNLKLSNKFEDEYLTFHQAAQRFPAFTEGSLRWHRFNDTSGFNRCIHKIGRKCVISLSQFLIWIRDQAVQTNNNNNVQ